MPIWDEWLENVTYKGDVRQMEQKHFHFNEKKRVVVKIGSSSLNYGETGNLNFTKLEHLVRELCNLRNRGMDVCLVSSGAIAVGRQTLGMDERPKDISTKQACAIHFHCLLIPEICSAFSKAGSAPGCPPRRGIHGDAHTRPTPSDSY